MSMEGCAESLNLRRKARLHLVLWIRHSLTVFGPIEEQELLMLLDEALTLCNVEMTMAKKKKPVNTKVIKGGKGMALPTPKNPGKKKAK